MNKYGIDNLVCPINKTILKKISIEKFSAEGLQDIIKTGFLYSAENGLLYPIINGVPIMLTFRTKLTESFVAKYFKEISNIEAKLSLPDLEPMPGEKSVQATFTEEWGGLGDDVLSFTYDEDDLVFLHRDVWLRMEQSKLDSISVALDVGCGFGKEARVLSKIFSKINTLVAVDLNLAVVSAGERLLETGKIFPVVASLFKLPFADAEFDHVHCQGVAHHTYSTKKAFESIEKKVKNNGSMFFWVYAWEDSFGVGGIRGFFVRLYWIISHLIFRPILSRAPSFVRSTIVHIISMLIHPVLKNRGYNKNRWKYQNTVHGIRDAFTPRYAEQLRWNEVLCWFEELGYSVKPHSSYLYQKKFSSRLLGIGICGNKQSFDQMS